MNKILITGGSGIIGTRLTEMLIEQGHEVSHLGRTKKTGKINSFVWDVDRGIIDEQALKDVDTVVHLAGATVADHRWTKKRKHEILESRTKSTTLLARYLERNQNIKTVVCASAIGYYGYRSDESEFTEDSDPGEDFLASVVKAWEGEVDKIQNKRIVKLRVGIVLSKKGGALEKMVTPIRWMVGSPLGTGKQWVSWIHLDDLCRMFIKAIEDSTMRGVYNATAPHPVNNKELTQAIAKTLHKPLWLPNVPAFVLNVVIGEMADIVLNGSIVSSKKIQQTGFKFLYPNLDNALKDLLSR